MPIYLNLLAEAQAEEEMRRHDPVKRAIWLGGFLAGLLLVWSGWLQIRIIAEKGRLNSLESRWKTQAKTYQQIIDNERDLREIDLKLTDLQRLATNRFLWGTVLNSLQQSVVDDVQLRRFSAQQNHAMTEEVKQTVSESGRVKLGKPACVTEKITLQLDAKDASATPGDQVGKFKETLAHSPFFQKVLGQTNQFVLKNLSSPMLDSESGRMAVVFSLECRLPERFIQ
jgi:hypothetical protein